MWEEVKYFIKKCCYVLRRLSTSKALPVRWCLTLELNNRSWSLFFYLYKNPDSLTYFQVGPIKLFWILILEMIECKKKRRWEREMRIERRWLREVLIMGEHQSAGASRTLSPAVTEPMSGKPAALISSVGCGRPGSPPRRRSWAVLSKRDRSVVSCQLLRHNQLLVQRTTSNAAAGGSA